MIVAAEVIGETQLRHHEGLVAAEHGGNRQLERRLESGVARAAFRGTQGA
jgi:hypothetical protein